MSKLKGSLVLILEFLLLYPILLDSPKHSSGNRTARSHYLIQNAIFHKFKTDPAFPNMENLKKHFLPIYRYLPKAHEGKQELAQPSHTTGRTSSTGRDTVFSQSCFRNPSAIWVKELYNCSARGPTLAIENSYQMSESWQRHGQPDGLRLDKKSSQQQEAKQLFLLCSSTTHEHTI